MSGPIAGRKDSSPSFSLGKPSVRHRASASEAGFVDRQRQLDLLSTWNRAPGCSDASERLTGSLGSISPSSRGPVSVHRSAVPVSGVETTDSESLCPVFGWRAGGRLDDSRGVVDQLRQDKHDIL